MNKVGEYLQEHLIGEVVDSQDALKFFATDMSIFVVQPSLVVYPRNENDVRKTARFTWQLAERGRVMPVTARGAGTDTSGGAIGKGVVMVFPAHLHHVLDVNSRSGEIVAEPGANFAKIQQALEHVGKFIPVEPASSEYSTIGGAVANNASGENGFKYGSLRNYVKSVRVVLANGEVIDTGRVSKRDLSKKLGLSTFEGEIYRSLDSLIEENQTLIQKMSLNVSKNNAGYPLNLVKNKDGSFDLTPLFVGSQGTLGIITEVALSSESYSDSTVIEAGFFGSVDSALKAVTEVCNLSESPASLEMVDGNLLNQVAKVNPNLLKGAFGRSTPAIVLLAEFDDLNERTRKKSAHKVHKIFEKLATETKSAIEPDDREALSRIRRSQSVYSAHNVANSRPLPIIDDGVVPISNLKQLIDGVYKIFHDNHIAPALWGHIGDGHLHMQPLLDLEQVGDRQRTFKIMREYYDLVLSLDGTTTGELNDGRLRGSWLPKVYGDDVYQLLAKVKKIFDPYGTLNPGVKIGVELDDIRPLVRSSYSLEHLYNHTPRS